MTNKTERWFVVSESELETLIISTADTVRASCNDEWRKLEKCEKLADKAEAACRAREVQEINAGFDNAWVEVKK